MLKKIKGLINHQTENSIFLFKGINFNFQVKIKLNLNCPASFLYHLIHSLKYFIQSFKLLITNNSIPLYLLHWKRSRQIKYEINETAS